MAPLETPISSCSFRMMGTLRRHREYDQAAEDLLGVKQSKSLVLGLSCWDRKEGRWIEPSCSKGQKVDQRLANLQCTERADANQKFPAVICSLDFWILEETFHPRGPEGIGRGSVGSL